MKGDGLTQAQLDRAREFVSGRLVFKRDIEDDKDVTVRFGDLVRLVAWYGALRFISGMNGIGTTESPAQTGVQP